MFKISVLPEQIKQDMINKKIWSYNCPISLDRLVLLDLSYIDFHNNIHNEGKMITMDAVAPNVINIFKKLLEIKFPINSIKLINEYNGDDQLSMEANNSSSFNFRKIENTNIISIHSYGLAIDINPKMNPYIIFENNDKSNAKIYPKNSTSYVNRLEHKPGMVEPIIYIFKENGFNIWGGKWTDPIDWHHFQPTRLVSQILAKMKADHAKEFFQITVKYAKEVENLSIDQYYKIINKYYEAPENFNQRFESLFLNKK